MAGQLTASNTGLSERAAAILDLNIEVAARTYARHQLEAYSARKALQARWGKHSGRAAGEEAVDVARALAQEPSPAAAAAPSADARGAAEVGGGGGRIKGTVSPMLKGRNGELVYLVPATPLPSAFNWPGCVCRDNMCCRCLMWAGFCAFARPGPGSTRDG
eukprot:COSAG01_NODE_19273_length_1020_cov_1.056460_1_plen_161_part_00